MNNTRKPASTRAAARSGGQGGGSAKGQDRQPQATGARRGSPATSVMKQFAKTPAERRGKP